MPGGLVELPIELVCEVSAAVKKLGGQPSAGAEWGIAQTFLSMVCRRKQRHATERLAIKLARGAGWHGELPRVIKNRHPERGFHRALLPPLVV